MEITQEDIQIAKANQVKNVNDKMGSINVKNIMLIHKLIDMTNTYVAISLLNVSTTSVALELVY